jgi:hypothetical protein
MVKKANRKWRMCIDFTDLNKTCLKDEFPFPRIDSLIDVAATSELMSLLDCYSGYHHKWMRKEDEPKTSFIILSKFMTHQVPTCRRFEIGGSLSRRVNVAACPSPDGSARGRARRGEVRWPEMGVREVKISRPSCSSRAQVGCACSRGLQASTRERERAASRERLSRPRPRAANPL